MVALRFHSLIRLSFNKSSEAAQEVSAPRWWPYAIHPQKLCLITGPETQQEREREEKAHKDPPGAIKGWVWSPVSLGDFNTCDKGGKLEDNKWDLWGHFRVGTTDHSPTSPALKRKKNVNFLDLNKNITLVVGTWLKDVQVITAAIPPPDVMLSTSSVRVGTIDASVNCQPKILGE